MGMFDSIRSWFGASKPAPITQPTGTDGSSAPGGYLWRGERNPSLNGIQLWLTISNAITNTVVISAAARYFLNLIAGTEWETEATDPKAKDAQRAVDIVRAGLIEADMAKPWSAIVRKAALYKFYGFSMHEWIVRRRSDGMIVFADVAHRPQYTIQWWDKQTEQDPLEGVVQQTRLGHRYYLPRERLFYCVDDTLTDDPAGIGMLRHVISHTRRLERYEQLEGIGFETDLRGIPYGRAPIAKLREYAKANNKSDAWVDDQIQALKDFGEGHVRSADLSIILDSSPYFDKQGVPSAVPQWALDLLKGDGAPLAEVASAINRVNLEIARVIGAEFMMMGGTSSGSHSMHADKTDQFGNLIQSTLGEVAGFARNDLARTLVALNGMDADTLTPKLLPGSVATESVVLVCQALQALATAGAPLMPGDPAIDQIRARLHLAEQPKLGLDVGTAGLPRTGAKPGAALGTDGKPKSGAAAPTTEDDGEDIDLSDLDASAGLGGGNP